MKKITLFLLAAFIVASCTITEKVTFNSKTGGDISYELDGSQFAMFMESMDTTGQPFSFGDSLAEIGLLANQLKTMNGINNVDFKTDNNIMKISFSFDDIDALNRAHQQLGQESGNIPPNKTYEKVSVKNKKEWIYRTWPIGESATDSTYTTMGSMLTYKLEASFPKKIKSVDSKNIAVSNTKINWTSTETDMGATFPFEGIRVKMK